MWTLGYVEVRLNPHPSHADSLQYQEGRFPHADISASVVTCCTPPPRLPGLRQLVPGAVAANAPHHFKLIDDLEDGVILEEQDRDVWQLVTLRGEVRKVDRRTVSSLLSKSVLEEQS